MYLIGQFKRLGGIRTKIPNTATSYIGRYAVPADEFRSIPPPLLDSHDVLGHNTVTLLLFNRHFGSAEHPL